MKTHFCILFVLSHFNFFSQIISIKCSSALKNVKDEFLMAKDLKRIHHDSIEIDEGKKILYLRNRIHLDVNLLGRGPSCFSYEHFIKSGLVGIELPINLYSYYIQNRLSSTNTLGTTVGLGLKFYFKENGNGFYFGPTFGVGKFSIESVNFSPYTGFTTTYQKFRVYPLAFKFGYQLKIKPAFAFNIGLTGGVLITSNGVENFAGGNAGINFSF